MKTIIKCDVAIIGGGISGTALLYLLARYTDLSNLCLIEKCKDIAELNSHGRNNSQTLHCGDIETNYTLNKAIEVKASADMVVRYIEQQASGMQILHKYPKMVIGVGEKECELLRKRFTEFKPHFPGLQLFEEDDVARIEPAVMAGREESVVGIGVENEYTAVNFQALAKSFVEQARQQDDKQVDIKLSCKVNKIRKNAEHYEIYTNQGLIQARFVVISAGGHSLLFAQRMGYGMHYSCLPVAGSFYFTPQILNGKVYTIQNDVLPFAAIHGDPDVLVDGKTRFGPTALILPMLERYNLKTVPQFLSVLKLDSKVLKVFWDLFKVSDIRNYIFKNFLFEVPVLRRWLFLRDARKIIPNMRLKDLSYAKKIGGIRPVMIDKENCKLHMGEAKISPGSGIIFNMTPSPGATSCLGNAGKDVATIVDYLKCKFDEKGFKEDLL